MGNKCCKSQSSTYSSANATIRSFSSYNSSIVRSGGSHALTFGGTSTRGDSLTTLTMKSSDHSDVGKDYRGGSSSTVGQDDPIPVFLRRLNDLNTRVGTRTRFLIELDDASGVQVRWYHNNLEAGSDRYQYIHEGGFYCLDIVPVTLEDEGLWVCTAQNYAGKSSTAAHLSLIVPKAFKKPIFVEPLRAVLTQRGIVSLECKVIGVPTPKLRWYKDDREIKAGDIFALTANSEDCLGIYTCEATNVMGTTVSTSKIQVTHTEPDGKSYEHSLIPYGPSPRFVKGLKNATGKVGNVLTLECQVEIPPWPRSVGWYNDAGVVNEGALYHLLADGMGMYGVEIKSLRADHGTTWKCVATSLTGAKAVTSCLVTVSYPKNYRVPRFLESLRAIMTDEGLVSFECKVIGYPTPQLCWFKDGKQLQPGDVYELTGSKSLGTYCCVARNCMGETSSVAELTIEDIQNQLNESEKLQLTSNTQPPRFSLGLKSAEATINESFVFMVKVTTESTPSISWYKEDEELTESNRYQFSTEDDGIFVLNIVTLEIDDQAEWKCVAVNKYGQTVTSSFLKLNIPKNFKSPRFLEELRIAFSNEGSVNLECKVIGVPQPQLKWFKDGQELNPGDMHKIISGQSGTCCLGTYTCQAHNCMGTVSSSATLLTMEDKSTVKSCTSEEYLSVGNPLVRNESLSTIPEERTSQMEKSYTIEEPADISFSFDGKEVTVSLYETPDLTHDEALQIIEMYADELSEHISEDNVVDLPSLRIVKESSISGPVMMEALVIDVPIGFCQQQTVSDTEFDGVSLTEDTTLANVDKNDSLCENSLEYFSDHFSSSNSKRDVFFSASETTPKNASLIEMRQQSQEEGPFQTPKLFMSDSDDQILTQLKLEEKGAIPSSRKVIGPLARSESNNTEEEVSETLADVENELPLPHNYCEAEISPQSDDGGLCSAVLKKIQTKGVSVAAISPEEDDGSKIVSRPNVDEFLNYMKILLEGTVVKMHAHQSFNYTDSPTELEHSIQALHSLAWKFIEETEKDDVTELDKSTTENVSSLMTAINAGLLALEQIDDPFGVSDNVLNEIQSSVCLDLETLNNKELSATDILNLLSDQIQNFTIVVNRQVSKVTEQRVMAVLRNTIGTTLVYIKTLQQNSSKIKCIDISSLTPIFSMVQPLETILNDIALIEEASAEDGKCNLKFKQMLIPPISSIAFALDNLNKALKNENPEDDQDLRDIYSKINDATNQFMVLASQGTEAHNLAECFISFTKPINDLCCHLRRLGRSTENIISSDYGSDDKLLMDFETLFDELMMDIDTLINNVNVVRDSENNMNPLGSLLEPLQDMKIGLFQVNQVLLSNQTSSNMSYEVMSCFEHLSHQLVQLNNCIINQSIVEETDKELPFESSIKLMQNILFDDSIDDLGVNGILFGSVMKPLLQLQNLIVSKMASVESDLSFSEHTDATGGAQSLSLSLSNNAQTVFDKADEDNLKPEKVELPGKDNTAKDYDTDDQLLQASISKVVKESMHLGNNGKNDLVPKRDFKCDIEETFKDEEPSIIMPEDDRENSGFEVLFDETDLETVSDFIDNERSYSAMHSEIEPVDVLMGKSDVGSVNDETDYNIVIPQHVLASFDNNIEPDSTLNSSDDLFDELQETLKNITEGTLDETKEAYLLDENSLKNYNSEEKCSHRSDDLTSQTDVPIDESLDEDKPTARVLIKQIEFSEDNTEKRQHGDIILKSEHDETCVNQIDQVSETTQEIDSTEEVEFVDSDKTISNNTIITNHDISDSLEIKTVKINNEIDVKTAVDAFTSSNVQNKECTSKIEDLSDEVQDEIKITSNDQPEIEKAISTTEKDSKNSDLNNITSEPAILKHLEAIKCIESNDGPSEKIHSRDIKSSEKQINEPFDFLETCKVSENASDNSNESTADISLEIEDDGSLIQVDTEKLADSALHVDTLSMKNSEDLLVSENYQQQLDKVKIEGMATIKKTETENETMAEVKKLLVPADECDSEIEQNKISIVSIEGENDKTTKDCLPIESVNTPIIEENINELKPCVSNSNDDDEKELENKISDAFEETVDQINELASQLNSDLKIVSENKTVDEIIDEPNNLKGNVILGENIFDTPSSEVELIEEINVDKISNSGFQERENSNSTTENEQIGVSDSSQIPCENTENPTTDFTDIKNKDHVPCSSSKMKSDSGSFMNEQLENVEQVSLVEGKSDVQNIDDTGAYNTEESNEKCKNSSNVVETRRSDGTNEEMVLPAAVDILIDSKRVDKGSTRISNDLNEIESDFTIKQNIDNDVALKSLDDEALVPVVDLEVPSEPLKKNNELHTEISIMSVIDKPVGTENNENETVNPIPNESCISDKEVIGVISKCDTLNEIASDFSNEVNVEQSIPECTLESKNDLEYVNTFDKSIRGLEQISVLDNENVANDSVCELIPSESQKEPLLLIVQNSALISSEVVAAESTQLLDVNKSDGNEMEVKYEENRKNAILEQQTVLESIDDNTSDSEHLETKYENEEEQSLSKSSDLEKESIEFNKDSSNVSIEQNPALVCDEANNSIDGARPIAVVNDNNLKIVGEKCEKVLENLIDTGNEFEEQAVKNKPCNESSALKFSDELTRNNGEKEEYSNVTSGQNEIQTPKSYDEITNLAENRKEENAIRTENGGEKLTEKSELYDENGIESSITDIEFDKNPVHLESTINTKTDKDKIHIDETHSCDSKYLPSEENEIKNLDSTEYNSNEQKVSVSIQENIALDNIEVIAVDSTQVMIEPINVCCSNLEENDVSQPTMNQRVTEGQTVDILESADNFKTNIPEECTELNPTEDIESRDVESEFNGDDNEPIKEQSRVSMEESSAILSAETLGIGETKSLKPCDIAAENASETTVENLVGSVKTTEVNVLETSIEGNEDAEKIVRKESNTDKIKKELIESKDLKTSDISLETLVNDTPVDVTMSQEETNNIKSPHTENKIECISDITHTDSESTKHSLKESLCVSEQTKGAAEQNIPIVPSQDISNQNQIENNENVMKIKPDDEGSSALVNDQENKESDVSNVNNDDERSVMAEPKAMALEENESKTLNEEKINERINVSDLEKKADVLCETVTEDEIIDLIVEENLSDLTLRPKLHCVEQKAANQTECVTLESANILKQDERSTGENIIEHARVEHELNIAAIGNMVMDYDSVKENTSKSSDDQCDFLETAIIATIDGHSNEIVLKNIDVLNAPNEDLIINKEDLMVEKASSGLIDNAVVISEDENNDILTTGCVKEQIENDDKSKIENNQIRNEVIKTLPEKTEGSCINSDENIFKELHDKDNVDNMGISTDVIDPLNDNNTQTKKNEPTLNLTNNAQDIKITNSETTNDTDDGHKIRESLTSCPNKSSPDFLENVNESNEENKFISEVKKGSRKLSDDKDCVKNTELNMQSENKEDNSKNISIQNENITKVLGGIEKVESNENQIDNKKSNQLDAGQVEPMKDKVDSDNKKRESKKKKTSPQPQDKKLHTPDKSFEKSESEKKTLEKTKSIDLTAEKSSEIVLEDQEKTIKQENKSELDTSGESNTIISEASNNENDENMVKETEKSIAKVDPAKNQENIKIDSDKTQSLKEEEDTDKKKRGSKKKKKSPQPLDKKLSSLDTSLEKGKIEIDEKTKVIESSSEENIKKPTEERGKIEKRESKLEQVITKENNKNTSEVLQNENSENALKETDKTLSNDGKTESSKLEADTTQIINNEVDTDKKKRGSKKKKTIPQPNDKKSPSPNKSVEKSESGIEINKNKEIIESMTEEKNKKSNEIQKNIQNLESKSESENAEEITTNIEKKLKIENNENALETDKTFSNADQTKNNKPGTNQTEPMKDEVNTDKKKRGSKKKKTSPQPQDKNVLKPDKSMENSDIKNEIDEKTKTIDSTTDKSSTIVSEDQEKIIKLDSKSKPGSSEESKTIISKASNNENDENVAKDTDKVFVNDNQTENQKDNAPVADKTQMVKDEVDMDKRKRGSKKKKSSPQPQEKQLPSLDKSLGNSESEKIIDEKLKIIESTAKVQSKNLTGDTEKPESKFEQVIALENNENTSEKLQDKINETDKTILNDDQTENNKLEVDKKKSVKNEINTDKKKRGSKKKKRSQSPQNEKSALPDELIAMANGDHKVIEVKSIMDSDVIKDDMNSSDKSLEKSEKERRDTNKNELNTISNEIAIDHLQPAIQKGNEKILDNSKTEIFETNDKNAVDSKKSKEERVKSFEEIKRKTDYKEAVQPKQASPEKSRVKDTAAETRITERKSHGSYDRDSVSRVGQVQCSDDAGKQTVTVDEESDVGNSYTRNRLTTAKHEEHAGGQRTNHVNTVTKTGLLDAPVARRMNFESRSLTPCRGFEHGVTDVSKTSARPEERLARGKDVSPSRRYLAVTDAYRSRLTPLTYRSLTPELSYRSSTPGPTRFSESRKPYARSTAVCGDVDRYRSTRPSSPYTEPTRPAATAYYSRNLSLATTVYRSPSETVLRTYRRQDDEDLSSRYTRRRRHGSDSFLHGLDSSWDHYSSWRLSSGTKDDLDRTKETFKKLYFCVRLIDQTVSSGARVKFWCSVIGYPEPRVQWYRDGQKLNSFTYNSSARYQTKYTNGLAQLIIDDAQSGDSGEYTCVAVNSGDRISSTGFLTVYTSPTVFGAAPKRSLQTASLSAEGFKTASLDKLYLWSGDDLRQSFRIGSGGWRSSDDTSRYPKYPKFVTTILADDVATYGGTIALQVQVQGSPSPNVTWLRESKPLPRLSVKYVYLDEGGLHTLLVKDSTARDGGTYVCRACNLYGTANAEKAVRVVSSQDYSEHRGVKPAIIVSRPNDRMNVAVGEDITVTLRVAGEPKPKVVWMRGSRDVTFLDRSLKETVNDYVMLSIKKAQLSDAGTYFIIAKNVYGSDRAFVTVGVRKRARSLTPPPRIRNTIGRCRTTAVGGSAKNDVPGPVSSEPVVSDRANNRLSLRWGKPDMAETVLVYRVEAQSADEECWIQVGMTPTNSIDVYNLKPGNRYRFRVTARNRFGWGQPVVTSDYVDVCELKHLPEFVQPLSGETKVLLRHSAKLQCHVRGVPVPQVTWFKDGEPLQVTARYATERTNRGRCTLTITDAADEDAGRYACEAVNGCGRVTTLTVVEVMANRRVVEAEQRLQGCLMKNNDFKESAPAFTKRLIDRRVEVNSTVRLSCQVHGLPVPSVSWYKDNRPVDFADDGKSCRDSDDFYTLELTNVKYDDSGVYTAVASSSIGTATTRCVLEVINKNRTDPAVPEFIFGLPPTHEAAESIILKAQIDAYRPVKVEWFRDGIQLRNGRRVDIITDHDGNLELRIACVTQRDSGTYTLRVSNDTGTIESRCDVDVVERKHLDTGLEQISLANNLYSKKPKFVVKPKFQEVEEGQQVIIDSEIVGDPLPKITWLRDGLKPEYYRDNSEFTCVSNGNRHQLKIPHAKLTHTGTYTLLAANPHGQIKALISLQVYSTGHCKRNMENGSNRTTVERLPRISRGLLDVECSENDCVAFECKLNITQETDVRWQKDGKLVRLGKEIKSELVGGDTARLEISTVGPLHEGLYTCTAFNELGQDSTSARLILLDSARDVTAKSTTPSNGLKNTMLGSPKLAGESNDRSSKRLKRSSAPKFYAVLHDKIADVGETVRFQCSVSGHPPPWSSWEKDGRPIGINSRMRIREDDDHRSLEICDITADDAGLYRITVENKFGKIQATARLEVMTHHQTNDVQITTSTNGRRQSGSTACAGENFTLSCDIRGNSMSDVTWYKDDEEVKPGDRVTSNRDDLAARLSISNLELADTGVYTCIARCESGVTRCSAELCVFDTKLAKDSYLQPPIFVEGLVPMRTAGEGERLELTVKLQGAVPMSATWFKDDVPVPDCEDFEYAVGDNGKFSLFIVDPFSADSGNYSCKVVNTFGEAVSHGQLMIKEIESDPPARPVTLQNTEEVPTELNNNSKTGGKDNMLVPRNEESTATAVTTAPLPATILWGPCDTTVLRGARVVLETSYAGNPEPSIQWLRAGKVLVETDERLRITNADGISSLTIDSITADDCGKYIVRVDNGLGNDYHFASVAVEGPPDPPAGRPAVSVSETSADVTWPSPAYDGGCMVTGYSVEVRPFNQCDWKLVADRCHSLSHIVRGLAPGESYVFRVRAENMHGSSEASLESIPVYILQTDYGNTVLPKKVNIENGELFTKQYEVLDELGKGRYGVVRKVKERETSKYYAAKFVRCIKSKDKEKAQEEVDIMNCLRHPKLLQLDAAYENPREVVMVTEYISGGELFERVVADDFTLTEKDCILFTRQICEGVDYMHKQSVVHLDLKPENIMCQSRTSHQVKLIDFGLAQKILPGKPIRVLFGTPEFIPPEIISYEPIGVESDMWSVGVICYVLLSGLSPFMGDNDAETFTNITKAEFDFDDDSFDAISQDSKDFISALLVKRKEKRLTARECLKHKWLAQQDMDMSCVILSTDKLKKFIIRRKWQKTGNAIRALGRMATMSAASRRCGGSGGSGGGGGGVVCQQFKMASLSEEESTGESSSSSSPTPLSSSSSPSPPRHGDDRRTSAASAADVRRPQTTVAEVDESTAMAVAASRGGRRSCDVRSDSGFSECSSLASSSSSTSSSWTSPSSVATGHHHHGRLSAAEKPSAIAEETCHPPLQPPATTRLTTVSAAATRPAASRSPAHVLLPTLGTGAGVCQKNRLIFDGTRREGRAVPGAAGGAGAGAVGGTGRVAAGATTTAAAVAAAAGAGVHRKEPIRIQRGDNFKKAVAFWKQ